jgi:hypothetical protein
MIEQHFTLASLPPSIEPASNFGHITSALVSVRIIFRFVFSSKESLLTASFFYCSEHPSENNCRYAWIRYEGRHG